MCPDLFFQSRDVGKKQCSILKLLYRDQIPRLLEPVFVNVYEAQESIPARMGMDSWAP
jgi:hypothetical protein